MTDRVIAVGGPRPLAPKSQARKCSACGELAYFTPETFRRLATERPGDKPTFYCLNCVPDEEIVMMPFNEQQVGEIQAAGVDLNAKQINTIGETLLRAHVKRRRKP